MFDARNMKMVTEYVKNTYGAQHRFMLTENGFEAGHGEEAQAAALAYSYYVAKYNDMIDNFILNVERGGIDFAIDGRLAGKVWNYLDDGDASHKAWIDSTCLPVIGEKHAHGLLGRIIDLFALFALLAGTATTFSIGNRNRAGRKKGSKETKLHEAKRKRGRDLQSCPPE